MERDRERVSWRSEETTGTSEGQRDMTVLDQQAAPLSTDTNLAATDEQPLNPGSVCGLEASIPCINKQDTSTISQCTFVFIDRYIFCVCFKIPLRKQLQGFIVFLPRLLFCKESGTRGI